jgi:pyruvate dehydrogenase E1 component beta subunit
MDREITFSDAVIEALQEEMRRDPSVYLAGECIQVSYDRSPLLDEFGPERVRDTPISETAIIASSLGAAVTGMRPVAHIMFTDFLCCCMDEIVNQVAKIRYMFGGKANPHLVIRVQSAGGGRSAAAQHAQSLESWFIHVPGLRVVFPSTPHDAKGLMKTAIRSDDPVMFFEHNQLRRIKGLVPEEEYTVPLGDADLKREGEDVTVFAYGYLLHAALSAAESLKKEGVDLEIVDPRTLSPLDKDTLFKSVRKTGRLVTVEEGAKTGGVGAEVSALVADEVFDYIDAPIKRVAALNTPLPMSPPLEKFVLPNESKIIEAVKTIV